MSRRRATYRIVLRGKRGYAKLRYAQTYAIYYGKRKILSDRAFPKSRKLVSERRAFLQHQLELIEKKRLRLIAQKKRKLELLKKRQKAKYRKIAIKHEENRDVKKAEPIAKETLSYAKPLLNYQQSLIENEVLDLANIKSERPDTLKEATIDEVIRIAIKPINDEYTKELIYKVITSEKFTEELHLTILNFSLKKKFIELTRHNFNEAWAETTIRLFPHMRVFFEEIHKSAPLFILRLKFRRKIAKGKWIEQGISLSRREVENVTMLAQVFRETFMKFLGKKEPGSHRSRTENYLEGENTLFISGFTLEATEI